MPLASRRTPKDRWRTSAWRVAPKLMLSAPGTRTKPNQRSVGGRPEDQPGQAGGPVRVFFRLLVQTMVNDAELTIGSALNQVRERIALDLAYLDAWLGLAPLQRESARAPLATGESRSFSRESRAALGAALGEEAPSAVRVRATLRRLERLGIADTAVGQWGIADPDRVEVVLALLDVARSPLAMRLLPEPCP